MPPHVFHTLFGVAKHATLFTFNDTESQTLKPEVGRDDFQFFWNFITAIQILPCVIETRRYGYIRDSGGRVETPHGATIGCEKSYNG